MIAKAWALETKVHALGLAAESVASRLHWGL